MGRAPPAPDAGAFTSAPPVPAPAPSGLDGLGGEYTLDLGQIFDLANRNFGASLGPMVGAAALWILITFGVALMTCVLGCVPILGQLAQQVVASMVIAPLSAGFFIVALAQIRGKSWNFGDFFSGFKFWLPIFLNNLFQNLLLFICQLPGNVLNLADSVTQLRAAIEAQPGAPPPPHDPTLGLVALGLQIVGLLVYVPLMVRYFLLCNLLIVDRGCNAIEAIRGNMRLTEGHFLGWLGLTLLFGLIAFAGVLLCLIGALFSYPYVILLLTAAYLVAVGERH